MGWKFFGDSGKGSVLLVNVRIAFIWVFGRFRRVEGELVWGWFFGNVYGGR